MESEGLTLVDGLCTNRSGEADDAYRSLSTRPLLPPQLNSIGENATLRTELKDNFCIIMIVNVMDTNDGPLFVAYDTNSIEMGNLTVTSSGVTLQLYGVEATFARDFTGSFQQISICVHDGVAELYEGCESQETMPFIVQSDDIISRLSFGQSISIDGTLFQVWFC